MGFGMLALLVASLGFFRTVGLSLAITVAIGLAVAGTLIPALMAIFGQATFWPALGASTAPMSDPVEVRGAHWIARRYVAAPLAIACIAVLAIAASPLRDLRIGFPLARSLPSDSEPARAERAASLGFAPGITALAEVVVEGHGVVDQRKALERLEVSINNAPGVAGVMGARAARAIGSRCGLREARATRPGTWSCSETHRWARRQSRR